ncbi:MAG: AAA family ATPase [Clostridiaceae bacterium]|nr:AAA family ATPase [Clostridiaceae bacterium]
MLVRFSVGNFLSFKEVQEFSMLKGKPKNKSERVLDAGKLKLLKFAAVFGANASGKSNLVSSIKYAQTAIVYGVSKKGQTSYFKIDADYINKPSYFEFEILLNNNIYAYGFEILLKKSQIVSEWLIQLSPTGNDKIIFSRDVLNGDFQSDLRITSQLLRNKFSVYADDCKNNTEILFLNEMNRAKAELYKDESELFVFKEVFDWFVNKLDVNYPNRPISNYSYFREVKNKDEVCRVIRSLGTGITNYEERKSSLAELQQQMPKVIYERLEEDIEDWKNEETKGKKRSSLSLRVKDMYYVISIDKNNKVEVTTIVFNHGSDAVFQFDEESDGTRRILDLIEILFTEKEKVYIIDEIDRSLHPQLTYKFIQEFLAAAQKRNIQMIVTTHESRLLDFGLLRQDEIWIANKLTSGETELYSLDEYNVRFDKKIDKAYLEGRYGGVPIFSTIFPIKEADG